MTLDPSSLCQIEIHVADVPTALSFYESAFGWRPVPATIHRFYVLEVPPQCPFGIAVVPLHTDTPQDTCSALRQPHPTTEDKPPAAGVSPQARGRLVLYFRASDPEAFLRQAIAAGAIKRFGPVSVAGYGQVWQLEDPFGMRWGIYSDGDHQVPFP